MRFGIKPYLWISLTVHLRIGSILCHLCHMEHQKPERGVVIPYKKLSREALLGLVEEFVTRHGTDGGYTRASLGQNVEAVLGQLDRGEAEVVYDQISQTANIVPTIP